MRSFGFCTVDSGTRCVAACAWCVCARVRACVWRVWATPFSRDATRRKRSSCSSPFPIRGRPSGLREQRRRQRRRGHSTCRFMYPRKTYNCHNITLRALYSAITYRVLLLYFTTPIRLPLVRLLVESSPSSHHRRNISQTFVPFLPIATRPSYKLGNETSTNRGWYIKNCWIQIINNDQLLLNIINYQCCHLLKLMGF